jgi:hypothetical protein
MRFFMWQKDKKALPSRIFHLMMVAGMPFRRLKTKL